MFSFPAITAWTAVQAPGPRVKYRGKNAIGPGPYRPGGADVLQHLTEGASPASCARRNRPRLPAARPACHDAVGWRSAAHQDRLAFVVANRRSHPVRARRADDRPALRRYREAADRIQETDRCRHSLVVKRTQPGCPQTPHLATSVPRGAGGRRSSQPTPDKLPGSRILYGAVSLHRCCPRFTPMR